MSTCEEPRAPNGPSPIATASGQRSVTIVTCTLSKNKKFKLLFPNSVGGPMSFLKHETATLFVTVVWS